MAQEIQIQTVDEVKTIDYMKNTNQIINNQIEEQAQNINDLSDTLDVMNDTLSSIVVSDNVDLSELTESINSIDTTVVEAQTQDILTIVNNQQTQINSIKEDVQEIKQLIKQLTISYALKCLESQYNSADSLMSVEEIKKHYNEICDELFKGKEND